MINFTALTFSIIAIISLFSFVSSSIIVKVVISSFNLWFYSKIASLIYNDGITFNNLRMIIVYSLLLSFSTYLNYIS